jgi:putative lipoic acid-binding regulatory protein
MAEEGVDPRRLRALALLESQHTFPGPFEFRVVMHPEGRAAVLGAMMSAAGPDALLLDVSERSSTNGKYLSLRVKVRLGRAEDVLEVYEVIRAVDDVITAL